MKRRVMALFLVLTMLVSMAPAAFATDTGFTDVPADAWYSEAVAWAVENGITGGIGDGLFGPDNTCTRGQVVTFLWAAAGKPVLENADNPFVDVSASDWYYTAVMWAVANNVTGGTSANTFSPEAPCTRAQVVTFLYAAEGKPAVGNAANSFLDVAVNDWFYAPVMWAVANDITGGIGNGLFGPDNACTRGQIALFLYKADQVESGTETTPTPKPTAAVADYAVCDLEIEWEVWWTLSALVSASEDCKLVMEVLSEDGTEQLLRVEETVQGGTQLERVEYPLPISAQLPQYFLLRAILQDTDGKQLCDPFVSRHYTEAYERFSKQMESDFAPDRVIDLIEKNDGNFVVIHDEVQRLEQTDGRNVLCSRADGVCVFEQADETLRGMKAGDKLLITDTDGQYAGIIIEEITLGADGVVEIYEAEDATLSDFYSLIKIEADLKGKPDASVPTPLRMTRGSEDEKYLREIEMGSAVSNSVETVFGSVETSLSAGAKMEFVYDPEMLGKDYMEYSLLAAVMGGLEVTIEPDADKEGEIEIISIPLVGLKEIAEIPAKLSIVYEVDCQIGGKVTVDVEAVTGFVYKTGSGTQRVEYKDSQQREFDIRGGVELKLGLRASIDAEFFDDMLTASLGAETGVVASGEVKALGTALPDTESYHACLQCVDGHLTGYFEVEIRAKYDVSEWLQGDVFDLDLVFIKWDIGRCYLSIISAEDGVFDGYITFGWGACPNRKYRVKIETYRNGEQVTEVAKLSKADGFQNSAGTLVNEKETPYTEYLYPGAYHASANIGIQYAYEAFTVTDDDMIVKLKVENPVLSGTVVDNEELEFIDGAQILIEKDGAVVHSLSTDAVGMFSVQLEPGTYTVTCSAEDYHGMTQEILLRWNESLLFELERKAPGVITGTVSEIRTVDGVETNVPVSHAVVTVYEKDRIPVQTISMAGTNGVFELCLPMGDYTVEVTAEGYDTYETSITVTSKDVEVPVVLVAKGTNEAAYEAYIPMVEQAIRDTNEGWSFDVAADSTLSQGYLADLDGDGIDELLMCYYRTFYESGYRISAPVYSVYDYENGALVKVVERKKLIQAMAGGDLGSAAIVDFDGKPTVMIMDKIGDGGGPGVTHLYNYEFYDYPSMERKYLLGYWHEEGVGGLADEKFYINDVEATKASFFADLARCPELRFSQRGYDFYSGDPMSLRELLDKLIDVQYENQLVDRSYYEDGELRVEYSYNKIVLLNETEAAKAINAAIDQDAEAFLSKLSNEDLKNAAQFPMIADGGYLWSTADSEVTNQSHGIFSIRVSMDWYMGGVGNLNYYGLNFDLTTGEPLVLTELFGMAEQELTKELKNRAWAYLSENCEDNMFEGARDVLYDYTLDEFLYYFDDGELIITFPTYTLGYGAAGAFNVPTGMMIE